jgi:hypothetical protein
MPSRLGRLSRFGSGVGRRGDAEPVPGVRAPQINCRLPFQVADNTFKSKTSGLPRERRPLRKPVLDSLDLAASKALHTKFRTGSFLHT